jgi:hypothetical protein
MKVFTIGFTRRSAEDFFSTLKQSEAARVVDVRLNNSSQLAGFSKRDDLRFFCKPSVEWAMFMRRSWRQRNRCSMHTKANKSTGQDTKINFWN